MMHLLKEQALRYVALYAALISMQKDFLSTQQLQ